MKKLIYILLFAFTVSSTFTACTEEEIKPSSEFRSGKPSDPK